MSILNLNWCRSRKYIPIQSKVANDKHDPSKQKFKWLARPGIVNWSIILFEISSLIIIKWDLRDIAMIYPQGEMQETFTPSTVSFNLPSKLQTLSSPFKKSDFEHMYTSYKSKLALMLLSPYVFPISNLASI